MLRKGRMILSSGMLLVMVLTFGGLRYVVLLLAGLSLLSGYTLLLELTEPYSIFGRILNDLLAVPVSYGWNGFVDISERYDWLPMVMKAEVQ